MAEEKMNEKRVIEEKDYNNTEKKKDIEQITSIYNYIEAIKQIKEDILLVIAVKDTVGIMLSSDIAEIMYSLGITTNLCDQHWHSYIAVINRGEVIVDNLSNGEDSLSYDTILDGADLSVFSSIYKRENTARIVLNGIDYAINSRGLNFVIYDWDVKRVIDSVCFDTHVSYFTCKRQSEKIYSSILDMEKQIFHLKKQVDMMSNVLNEMNLFLKANMEKEQLLLWQCYRNQQEEDSETKKRFFQSLPKATGTLRKVQLAGSILLQNFDRICRENHIIYWIGFGTLLGAIRHKGFIPWDDDTDVCMMRDQLEKLKKAVEKNEEDFIIKDFYFLEDIDSPNINHCVQFHFKFNEISCCLDIFLYDYCLEISEKIMQNRISLKEQLSKLAVEISHKLKKENKMKQEYDQAYKELFEEFYQKERVDFGITDKKVGTCMIWAIDNLKYIPAYRSNRKLSEMFPLEKVMFEGYTYWAPHEAEKYANQLYENIYTIPDDIVNHRHFELDSQQKENLEKILAKYKIEQRKVL